MILSFCRHCGRGLVVVIGIGVGVVVLNGVQLFDMEY